LRSRRPAWAWLLHKEWRELVASRAFWVMLFLTGPLVGVSFINAVNTYAELSGLHGTASGTGEAFSPLIGVWAPTFGAYELVAAFLLPFVAIRVVSGDRQTGALKLEQQQALSSIARVIAKTTILLTGWVIASVGAILALALWRSYGGSLYVPEIIAVAIGHLLNAALTISLAAAASALAEHPATAAILTLGFTIGTWVVNFIGAVRGGIWEQLACYTPPVVVAAFHHGLVRLDVVLITLVLTAGGLAITAVWLRTGTSIRQRTVESLAIVGVGALAICASTLVHASWDASEGRYNSFAEADESALLKIHVPIRIEVHLAPEDPRRLDVERHALSKLRRVLTNLEIRYVSSSSVGLFEQTSPHYGEIWYDLGGRRAISRLTTAEGVLETIYDLAGVNPPPENEEVFRGHPLPAYPRFAAAVFYGAWPTLVLGGGCLLLWRKD